MNEPDFLGAFETVFGVPARPTPWDPAKEERMAQAADRFDPDNPPRSMVR